MTMSKAKADDKNIKAQQEQYDLELAQRLQEEWNRQEAVVQYPQQKQYQAEMEEPFYFGNPFYEDPFYNNYENEYLHMGQQVVVQEEKEPTYSERSRSQWNRQEAVVQYPQQKQRQQEVDEDALALYSAVFPDVPRALAIEFLPAWLQEQGIECLKTFNGDKKEQSEEKTEKGFSFNQFSKDEPSIFQNNAKKKKRQNSKPLDHAQDIRTALQQNCPQLLNDRVIQFYQNNPKIGISPQDFAQEMKKRLAAEKRDLGNNEMRIKHVVRTLEFMQTLYPGLKYKEKNYDSALEQRDAVYNYCIKNKINILSDDEFSNIIELLKEKLGKKKNDPLGNGLYFDTALAIMSLEEDLKTDQKRTTDYFYEKQSALLVKCLRLDEPYYFTCNTKQHNLSEEWERVIEEIDRIAKGKSNDLLQLNFAKLTYNDQYSAFFDRNYEAISIQESNALRDRLLNLIRTNMHDASRKNLVRKEAAQTYGNDNQNRIYFEDSDGEITGRRNALYSLPKNADATCVYFIGKIKEYFKTLNAGNGSGDKGFFRARAKILLEAASPCLIPDNVPRPNDSNFDQNKWDAALNEAQFKMALRIAASLEGCDTGKDRKLGAIEKDCRDVLGIMVPDVPLVKSVASIVRGIKLERIAETGLNPDENRTEERETTPQVLTQRLRGALGLLGNYMPITAPFYGYPEAHQNAPIQIIRNLFEEGQPARFYHTGPVPEAKAQETSQPIFVPVAPCLTVKQLVEKVYEEFGKSIKGNDLHQFLKGNLELIQEQINVDCFFVSGVFYKPLAANIHTPKPQDQFTREMAFYILEKVGYVTIDEKVKKQVYKVDKNNELGTFQFEGKAKTLAELINAF